MIGSEAANYDDCPPHRHASYGPGLAFCETHQQLLVDVDVLMGVAGLDDANPAAWEEMAVDAYRAVDMTHSLPAPCLVVLTRSGEQRAYQVDVRFSTKGQDHGEG